MRILVLGGGQFQGRRAVEMFVEAGDTVTVVNRTTGAPAGVRYLAGDIDLPGTVDAVLAGNGFDVVIDNRAYDGKQLEPLLRRFVGYTGHYVLISSFVVYGHSCDLGFRPVTEAEADLRLETGGDYDVGKRRCESVVRAVDGIPWTILRLAQIEGPGDRSNRRGFWIDRVADGGGLLVTGDTVHPYQPVWRDDAARAVVAAAGNAVAYQRTFNVAGDEIFTLTEWLGMIAAELGVPMPLVVQLPMPHLRALAGFEYRAPSPMRPLLDTSAIVRELKWRPTPASEWLAETVAWWRNSGLTSLFWASRPQEIDAINRLVSHLNSN